MEDFSYEFGPGSFERTAKLTQKAVKERLAAVLGTEFELRFSGAAYPSLVNRQVYARHALFQACPENVLDAIMRDDSTPSPIGSKGKGGMIGSTRADGSVDFTRSELEGSQIRFSHRQRWQRALVVLMRQRFARFGRISFLMVLRSGCCHV